MSRTRKRPAINRGEATFRGVSTAGFAAALLSTLLGSGAGAGQDRAQNVPERSGTSAVSQPLVRMEQDTGRRVAPPATATAQAAATAPAGSCAIRTRRGAEPVIVPIACTR